jgi:ABC-type multidrug transport system fused ATPase/permease subunit
MNPLPSAALPVSRSQTSSSAFRRLRRLEAEFVRPHRTRLLAALAGMLLQSLLLLPIPLLQGYLLDRLIHPRESESLVWPVVAVFVGSAACLIVRAILAWRVSLSVARASLEVVRELTDAMHRKLQRLPLAYFDREQTGRLMSRLTSDVGTLLIFLNSSSLQLGSDLVIAVGISATLLWLSPPLAAVAFVALPLYALNHRLLADRIRGLSRQVRSQFAAIYALLSERLSAVRIVRSFVQEDAEVAELDSRTVTHHNLSLATLRLTARQSATALFISGAGTLAVLVLGVMLAARGSLTVGSLLAFYALLAQLYNPIVRLTQFNATAAGTLAAVERIAEVLEEPEPLADRPNALPILRPRGALSFRSVSFSYQRGGPNVLDNVNLEVAPGERIGILGPSGSGKSTLLALAPRLYELAAGQGEVKLDCHDVRDVLLADLRRAVCLVPQQAALFEGTIRSNLTYARPSAGTLELQRALDVTELASFIADLPVGLDTLVGERGVSLSGGQRQRLALARALLADPAVLLLDDCTSALDAETEARIQDALESFLPGRTCLIVSHKVCSVMHADRIIILGGGQIVEQGTHDELLRLGGRYRQLYSYQVERIGAEIIT